jgi:outer membrane lipoprotein-sorting protein
MRFARSYLVLFLYFFLVTSAFALPRYHQGQQITTNVRRDPLAVNLLAQSLAVAGGSAVTAIQDFTGTGTITYNWAGEVVFGSVKVYGKGLDEFRMDSSVPAGNQSLVVNGKEAILTPAYDKKAKFPTYGMMTAGSLTFPAVRIAQVLSDSSIQASYLGSVTWNGSQAYQVHVALPLDPQLTLNPNFSGLGEFDLYFDPLSYRLLALAEKIWWDDDLRQSYLHEFQFSDYQPVNGMLVPLAIIEKMGGQQTWSMTLSSLTFNSGLSDTLFKFEPLENSPEG